MTKMEFHEREEEGHVSKVCVLIILFVINYDTFYK